MHERHDTLTINKIPGDGWTIEKILWIQLIRSKWSSTSKLSLESSKLVCRVLSWLYILSFIPSRLSGIVCLASL